MQKPTTNLFDQLINLKCNVVAHEYCRTFMLIHYYFYLLFFKVN